MSFKLGDFVGNELNKLALPRLRCATGKTCFDSKAIALASTRGMDTKKGRRTSMKPFRCAFCEKWHVGHRRGAVL